LPGGAIRGRRQGVSRCDNSSIPLVHWQYGA